MEVTSQQETTILQTCFEAFIKSGYNDGSNHAVANELLTTLLSYPSDIDSKRVVLSSGAEGQTRRMVLVDQLVKIATSPEKAPGVSVMALAYQFAIMLHATKSVFFGSRLIRKRDPIEHLEHIVDLIWDLYDAQYKQPDGEVNLTLELASSSTEIMEQIKLFDNRAFESLSEYIDSFGIRGKITIVTPEEIAAENKLPKPSPLQWSDELEPTHDCRYHHVIAQTPIGQFQVEWKGHKDYPSFDFYIPCYDSHISCNSLEEAKEKAYLWYTYIIRTSLGYTVREPT